MALFKKVVSFIAVLFLIVNSTYIYTAFVYFLNIPVFLISVASLLFMVIFICGNLKSLKHKDFTCLFYVVFLFLLPLVNSVFQFAFNNHQINAVYWIGNDLLLISLFLTGYILAIKWGNIYKERFFLFATFIILIGFVVNLLYPDLLMAISYSYGLENSFSLYGNENSRYFGWFLQSNVAGLSLFMLMVSAFLLVKKTGVKLLLISISIVIILLTGSRTNYILSLLFIIFASFLYIPSYLKSRFNIEYSATLAGVIVLFSFLLITIYSIYSGILYYDNEVFIRFKSLFSSDIVNDTSLQTRTYARSLYYNFISNNLEIGIGKEQVRQYLNAGVLFKPSHNWYVESALWYGMPYIIMFFVFQLLLLISIFTNAAYENQKYLYLLMFFVLSVVGFMVNGLYANRSLMVFTGLFYGHLQSSRIENRLSNSYESS